MGVRRPSSTPHGLFIRADANLHVEHVSDGPDRSLYTWSRHVADFQATKATPDMLTVHAIAGEHPRGCGRAMFGMGYYEATVATGGEFLSICAPSITTSLQTLADAVALDHTRFVLQQRPVPETIEVRVDDALHTEWTFDPSERELLFADAHMPAPGGSVSVRYFPQEACP